MKVYIGEKGLKMSWQEPFTKTIKCCKCGKEARIMFVGFEDGMGENICDLYETTGEESDLWLHDVCAIGVYLCPSCFEVTSDLNQA